MYTYLMQWGWSTNNIFELGLTDYLVCTWCRASPSELEIATESSLFFYIFILLMLVIFQKLTVAQAKNDNK